MPLAQTLVVINSFSFFPSRNLFNTAIRCSTVISPDNNATEWPSAVIFSANQEADFRVWNGTGTFTIHKHIEEGLQFVNGSLRSENGEGSANVALKVTSRSYNFSIFIAIILTHFLYQM